MEDPQALAIPTLCIALFNKDELDNFVYVAKSIDKLSLTDERVKKVTKFMTSALIEMKSSFGILEIGADMTQQDKDRVTNMMAELSKNRYVTLAAWISKDS